MYRRGIAMIRSRGLLLSSHHCGTTLAATRRWLAKKSPKKNKGLAAAMAKQKTNNPNSSSKPEEFSFTSKTTVVGEDPVASLLNRGISLTKMTTSDICAALDYRKVNYDASSSNHESLRRRLMERLILEHQTDANLSQEAKDYRTNHLEVQKYLPLSALALSNSLTGLEKEVLVLVPLWDVEHAHSLSRWDDGFDQPWATHVITDHFEQERTFTGNFTPTDISKVAAATLALYMCGASGVRLVPTKEIIQHRDSFHGTHITNESPIPKGWTHTPPPELPQEIREKILAAIEDVRRRLGEH